jgi:TonB family protein
MNPVRLHKTLLPLALLASLYLHAQAPKPVYTPLGNILTKALEISSLTAPGSPAFHVKLHIHNPDDATLQADIEEYWSSSTLWQRTITAPGVHQVITVNDTGTYYESTGDYFPLWLRNFVTALFNPVPNPDLWNQPGTRIHQAVSPRGMLYPPCLRQQLRMGTDSPLVNSRLCFTEGMSVGPRGLITSITTPSYSMQFYEFEGFHKKQIPHLYISQPASGQYFIGKIGKLENSSKTPDFFSTPPASTPTDSFDPISLSTQSLEQLAPKPLHIDWPTVRRGKTTGTVTLLVSLDRTGRVREASVAASDNHELDKAARTQVAQQQWKSASSKGTPIQVQGTIALPFSTTMAADAPGIAEPFPVEPSEGVSRRLLPSQRSIIISVGHQNGVAYLHAVIARDGTVTRVKVVESSSASFAQEARDFIKDSKYSPYPPDGDPIDIDTTIIFSIGVVTLAQP